MTSQHVSAPHLPARQALIDRLAQAFATKSHQLYLVGGAVRDRLLAEEIDELDFTTSALPEETASILECLDLGRPYRVGEKFGTIGLAVDGAQVEITTYRRAERYEGGSRKPSVQFGGTLQEDLERRDFTINAIAMDPLSRQIIDPLRGVADLTAGVLRAVGTPETRFQEDPLRLLRAIRFASRLGFAIDPPTWEAIRSCAPELSRISRERIRDEMTRMLVGFHPVRALMLLRDSGLLGHAVPLLVELTRMPDHGPRHPLSLWDHVMRVVEGVPSELPLRWAALLHDIAKPATRTHEPNGRPRFFHHEEVGAALTQQALSELRYSNEIIGAVTHLVETHMQLHSYSPEWSDGAVRRLMLKLGPLVQDAILLARADAAGHNGGPSSSTAKKFDHLQARIRTLNEAPIEALTSPLSGNDLMERYGRPPGSWIREVKDALQEEVLEGRLDRDDRERAFQIADSIVGTG